MKAIEKERGRRYATANGLAADLLRHLAYEPVLAAPPSRAYRLRKFVRKNRGAVIAASLLLLALLGGIAGTTWGLIRADKARAAAETALEHEAEARRAAVEAHERARRQVVRLHVGNGNAFLVGIDRGPALLWFGRAWYSDAAAGAHDANHRVRIGQTLMTDPDLIGLAIHDAPLTDAAIDATGKLALTLTKSGTAYLCDLATGRKTPLPHAAAVTAIALRPAGDRAITGSADGTASMWDAATGKRLHSLNHGEPVACVALATEGNFVATVGGKVGVKVWDAATGAPAGTAPAVPGAYYATFDPAGGKLLTADAAGFARVWDTATGGPLTPPRPHSPQTNYEQGFGYRHGPVFAPDGTRVITNAPVKGATRRDVLQQ